MWNMWNSKKNWQQWVKVYEMPGLYKNKNRLLGLTIILSWNHMPRDNKVSHLGFSNINKIPTSWIIHESFTTEPCTVPTEGEVQWTHIQKVK